MKKFISILLVLIISFSFVACTSSSNSTTDHSQGSDSTGEQISVDENLLTVDITLPADFVGEDYDGMDYGTFVIHEDGSATITMTKSEHKKLLKELKDTINESLVEFVEDGTFSSVKQITANNDINEFTFVVDRSAFENGFDGFIILGVAFQSSFYQLFEGIDSDNIKMKVILIDETSNEIYNEYDYFESLRNSN